MSNWTHVAGIIRVDGLRVDDLENITGGTPDFDELIGKEVLFDSPSELWDESDKHPERFLPRGSDGSLQKTVWKNPDEASVATYTVSIFGDLRDHDDPHEITQWFRKICDKFWVRNAVITANNTVYGSVTYSYESD